MGEEASMSKPKTGLQFVFIHGSWHHGGHWKEVQEALEERGHQTYAPTLLGNEPGAERINYPLKDIVAKVRQDIVSRDLRDFVLVGHSSGGYTVQQICQLEPLRVKQVIFLNAFVLRDGEDFISYIIRRGDTGEKLQAPSAENNYNFPRELPFDEWRKSFANSVDLETSKALYATLVPQGGQAYGDTQDLKKFFELSVPRTYLYLTDDPIFGAPYSETSWHPFFSSRLGADFKLLEMPGDHEVMLTSPVRLAEKLIEACSLPSSSDSS